MKVRDLMTRDVRTCQPHSSLNDAAQLMWESDCGSVPIVDEARRVVGMLTDRDICMAAYTQGKPLGALRTDATMAKPVVSCRPDDELAAAERAMQKAQVRRLPVLDPQGRLVGILSLNDLTRQASRDRANKTRAVGPDEIATTLAAIGEPRRSATAGTPPAAVRAASLLAAVAPDPGS